ncbi:MAG: T9SS type A sorting domain-containing protein [Bacteroidales bacterium]
MKKIYFVLLLSVALLFGTFNGFAQVGLQNIKFCVISDMHYFDTTLLINDGIAFQMYLAQDRKLLKESNAIMQSLFDSIVAEHPDIVLIPGDLTKDGENLCHQKIAAFLLKLKNANIKVFVAPGNHDINNPASFSFDDDTVYAVPSITPIQFKTIYNNYGYYQAIKTDTASLSYLAEPIAGLQILSMDVCRYDSNYVTMQPTTSGGFKPHVLQWAKDRLIEAKLSGKVVLALQHHNMMEHYVGQNTIFPEYVIDDYDTISTQLADLGLKVVFTGHYHAQDIVKKTTALGHSIYDVETGSAITYPCPYRIMNLTTDTILHITGKRVQHINYNTGSMTFQQYALNNLQTGLPMQVIYMLMSPPYNVDSATAYAIEPAITETFIAHFNGDEGTPSAQTQATIAMLQQSPYAFVGYILEGIWDDPEPDDWTVNINLKFAASLGIAEQLNVNNIILFPNPSKGIFNIILPDIKDKLGVKVFDINGRLVYEKESSGMQFIGIDISNHSAGQYVIQLEFNGTKMFKKIILR